MKSSTAHASRSMLPCGRESSIPLTTTTEARNADNIPDQTCLRRTHLPFVYQRTVPHESGTERLQIPRPFRYLPEVPKESAHRERLQAERVFEGLYKIKTPSFPTFHTSMSDNPRKRWFRVDVDVIAKGKVRPFRDKLRAV